MYDKEKVGYAFCGNPKYIRAADNCTQHFDSDKFMANYNTKCYGKKSCTLDLTASEWYKAGESSKCKSQYSRVYVQTTCKLQSSEMVHDKTLAIIATFLVLMISSCFYEKIREYQRN